MLSERLIDRGGKIFFLWNACVKLCFTQRPLLVYWKSRVMIMIIVLLNIF
jgi:hypothetical protein